MTQNNEISLKNRLIDFCTSIIDSEINFVTLLTAAIKRPYTDKNVLNYKKRISKGRLAEYQKLLNGINKTSSVSSRLLETTIEKDILTSEQNIRDWQRSIEQYKEPLTTDNPSVSSCNSWQEWRDELRALKKEIENQPCKMGQYIIT